MVESVEKVKLESFVELSYIDANIPREVIKLQMQCATVVPPFARNLALHALNSTDAVIIGDHKHPFVGKSYWPRLTTVEQNRTPTV